jgi:uncharacterized phage-associated protein
MSTSAYRVAAELRTRVPGIGVKKLHKLLYYCQGHHLGTFGRPLFPESISAWDMGPVVGTLWHAEKERSVEPGPPISDEAILNTIGHVVSRYGNLTGNDLERLTHAEDPWRDADQNRAARASVRIPNEVSPASSATTPTNPRMSAWTRPDSRPGCAGRHRTTRRFRWTPWRASAAAAGLMDRLPSFWQLENFDVRLDVWITNESPDDDLRIIVTQWVLGRFDNPYTDVSREAEFPNLWFAAIPESPHDGRVVVCSHWIFEEVRLVRCVPDRLPPSSILNPPRTVASDRETRSAPFFRTEFAVRRIVGISQHVPQLDRPSDRRGRGLG